MKNVLTPEEEKLSYAKYFYRKLTPIPQEKIDIWKGPAARPQDALPIENRNLFLDEPVPGMDMGFCILENGTGYVANNTFMPGVTPEMFDWWFGWHSVGSDLRYKLWDPEDHFYARASDPSYVLDPKVPNSQKTWGMTHTILEDIGMGPDEIQLVFKKPSDLGYDMSKIGKPGCAAIVCAAGKGSVTAIMTHKAVIAEGGIQFKSAFWLGYSTNEKGELVKVLPDGVRIPEAAPRSLFGHNIKEYSNLASILPEIYAEEKNNW